MSVRGKLALVLLLALSMAALVMTHTKGMNGPWYWWWPWRRLGFWPLYPAMLLAGTPFVLGQLLWSRRRSRAALACLFAATFLLMLTAQACQPPTWLRRLPLIVQNSVNTSYYLDASILHEQENISIHEWLYQYPDVVLLLHVHARYKPPGLMLYYTVLIALFGKGTLSASIGGIGIALMGSASVPATYAMLKRLSDDAEAAFCGASYLALCPSLLLFLPMFDQAYVLLTAVILLLYAGAVMRPGWRSAILFGATMALLLFLSYIFLIFGLFFVVYLLTYLLEGGSRAAIRAGAALSGAAALCCGLYFLLWVFTGFDPVTTFRVIEEAQTIALIPLERPFPQHLFYDLIDFVMGSGYISFLLVGFSISSRGRQALVGRTRQDRLVQSATLQIAVVAAAALLPGETARLWMLLLPLLMAPIGLELARWTPRQRIVVYSCLWLITVVLCQNMTFIYMGPELDGPR